WEGEPRGNAVVPRRVIEIGGRLDRAENPRKLERFPADSAIFRSGDPHLDRLGNRGRLDRPVAHADEFKTARRELVHNLSQNETDAGSRPPREGPQVDRDSDRAGHARARYGRPGERSTSPRISRLDARLRLPVL